eukprot:gene33860-35606_t
MEVELEGARKRANELEYRLESKERELLRARERQAAADEGLRISDARARDLEEGHVRVRAPLRSAEEHADRAVAERMAQAEGELYAGSPAAARVCGYVRRLA